MGPLVQQAYDDLVPLPALREGFLFRDRRVPFSSFQKGIHRAREMRGPAALSVLTAAPKEGKPPPYEDELDVDGGVILYHYRAGAVDQSDNRALAAAHELQRPLIYFKGMAPGQYLVVAPVFVRENDPKHRVVLLEVGIALADTQPGGPVSTRDARRYALREVRVRLHQQRFRVDVLRAYRHRCAICTLRERELVQAAHIVADPLPEGVATVVNGLALCAIHHLAYDRNLLNIDPTEIVHIGRRIREEHDGPMLREGLQGFHGAGILKPARRANHPDPQRLAKTLRSLSSRRGLSASATSPSPSSLPVVFSARLVFARAVEPSETAPHERSATRSPTTSPSRAPRPEQPPERPPAAANS